MFMLIAALIFADGTLIALPAVVPVITLSLTPFTPAGGINGSAVAIVTLSVATQIIGGLCRDVTGLVAEVINFIKISAVLNSGDTPVAIHKLVVPEFMETARPGLHRAARKPGLATTPAVAQHKFKIKPAHLVILPQPLPASPSTVRPSRLVPLNTPSLPRPQTPTAAQT